MIEFIAEAKVVLHYLALWIGLHPVQFYINVFTVGMLIVEAIAQSRGTQP